MWPHACGIPLPGCAPAPTTGPPALFYRVGPGRSLCLGSSPGMALRIGRASPGAPITGSCHAHAGPKHRASSPAIGPRAAWPYIGGCSVCRGGDHSVCKRRDQQLARWPADSGSVSEYNCAMMVQNKSKYVMEDIL